MADYFTLVEFRDLPTMGDDEKYTDDRINAIAASLTATIEREVGTSFIARNVTETLTACNQEQLVLDSAYPRSLTTVTVNGTTVATTDLFLDDGLVQYESGARWWPSGQAGNVVITYVAGYSTAAPADIKEALMWAVRDRLLATSQNAGIDARRTSMVTDQGTVNYVLAGEGRPTGYPDLDAAIMGWRSKLDGPGVA